MKTIVKIAWTRAFSFPDFKAKIGDIETVVVDIDYVDDMHDLKNEISNELEKVHGRFFEADDYTVLIADQLFE